jgi:ferredoxin-NADP reductase
VVNHWSFCIGIPCAVLYGDQGTIAWGRYAEPAALHTDRVRRLLFIAGGVGINPLYGMIRQLHRGAEQHAAVRAVLLYSACAIEELVFRAELDEMAVPEDIESGTIGDGMTETGLMFRPIYTATRGDQRRAAGEVTVRSGRISGDTIGEAIAWLTTGSHSTAVDGVYVCGPPGMAEEMVELCDQHNVPPEKVQFESWW